MEFSGRAVNEYCEDERGEDAAPLDRHIGRLTKRQKDCLELVANGYTSKEIGRRLALSPSTVDNHVTAATQTLFAANRAEAARIFSTSELGQKMTSQSTRLAELQFAGFPSERTEARSWTQWCRLIVSLPPIGGHRNDLDGTERTIRILQVATIGLGTMIGLTILIAGTFIVFG